MSAWVTEGSDEWYLILSPETAVENPSIQFSAVSRFMGSMMLLFQPDERDQKQQAVCPNIARQPDYFIENPALIAFAAKNFLVNTRPGLGRGCQNTEVGALLLMHG